jgi:hypothetical protein
MINYIFEFNLEENKVSKDTWGRYAVRYYETDIGIMVEIGDGYRHELHLEAKHWNRILRIIRDDELNESGVKAIVEGLMWYCLDDDYGDNFISAIRAGKIKEVEL